MTQMNLSMRQKQNHGLREQTGGCQGGGFGRGMEREAGASRCKLQYHTEWINNRILLYSKENHVQYPTMNHNGKNTKKECMYVYN